VSDHRPISGLQPRSVGYETFLATWRSGYAAACKAVYTGSIPVVAFGRVCTGVTTAAICGSVVVAPPAPLAGREATDTRARDWLHEPHQECVG
jgi:hypothetical protein